MITDAETKLLDARLSAEQRRLMDAYDARVRTQITQQVNEQLRAHYNLQIAEETDRQVAKYVATPLGRKQRRDYLAAVQASARKRREEVLEDMRLTSLASEQHDNARRRKASQGSTASQGNALLST